VGRARRRAASRLATLTCAALAMVASACAGPSGHEAAATTTTRARGTSEPAPALPRHAARPVAVRVAPGADLSVVSCGTPGSCVIGSAGGRSYRLIGKSVTALVPAVASPSPQGASWLSCAAGPLCAAAPGENSVTLLEGPTWQAPTTLAGAQGITAVACAGGSFCIVIDGQGNSYSYDGHGWSGNLGAWGAASQISCTSPSFCMAAEGGPSVWDGHSWTRPGNADDQGQLNAVSCASAAFCVLADSSGNVVTWNGLGFSAPQSVASEPPGSGGDSSGLTGVSCPTPTFCRAVDSLGRVFAWDGTAWNAGTMLDPGHALSAVSCPSTWSCVAVDRSGRAFVAAGSGPFTRGPASARQPVR